MAAPAGRMELIDTRTARSHCDRATSPSSSLAPGPGPAASAAAGLDGPTAGPATAERLNGPCGCLTRPWVGLPYADGAVPEAALGAGAAAAGSAWAGAGAGLSHQGPALAPPPCTAWRLAARASAAASMPERTNVSVASAPSRALAGRLPFCADTSIELPSPMDEEPLLAPGLSGWRVGMTSAEAPGHACGGAGQGTCGCTWCCRAPGPMGGGRALSVGEATHDKHGNRADACRHHASARSSNTSALHTPTQPSDGRHPPGCTPVDGAAATAPPFSSAPIRLDIQPFTEVSISAASCNAWPAADPHPYTWRRRLRPNAFN